MAGSFRYFGVAAVARARDARGLTLFDLVTFRSEDTWFCFCQDALGFQEFNDTLLRWDSMKGLEAGTRLLLWKATMAIGFGL